MDIEARERAWALDQHDPDNWLDIPDFGIQPQAVAFRGFAHPIVHPDSRDYDTALHIREMVRIARDIVRKEFGSLRELVQANLDAIAAHDAGRTIDLRTACALQYMIVMLALRTAALAEPGDPRRFVELAAAGEWLARFVRLDADRVGASSAKELDRLLARLGCT